MRFDLNKSGTAETGQEFKDDLTRTRSSEICCMFRGEAVMYESGRMSTGSFARYSLNVGKVGIF